MKNSKVKTCSLLLSVLLITSSASALLPHATITTQAAGYQNVTTLSKVELAQKLYDLAGRPSHSGREQFIDVTTRTKGYDAIVWANDRKLVTGSTIFTYSANVSVSLQDVVGAFYSLAGSPKTVGDLRGFNDHLIQTKKDNTLIWATQNRIITTNGKYLKEHRTVSKVEFEKIKDAYVAYINTSYTNYLCLGDSVAAGYYSGSGDTTWKKMDHAFHSLLATATGTNLTQLAALGSRSDELRMILDPTYTCDSFHISPNLLNKKPLLELNQIYTEAVANCDLITIHIGMNDILTAPKDIALESTSFSSQDDILDLFSGIHDKQSTYEALKHIPELVNAVKIFFEKTQYFYNLLTKNWQHIIQKIQEINPDATIAVMGGYTGLENSNSLFGKLIYTLGQPVVERITKLYQQQASTLGYIYVDVGCPDLYLRHYVEGENVAADPHPTNLGHRQITESILSVLPKSAIKNA